MIFLWGLVTFRDVLVTQANDNISNFLPILTVVKLEKSRIPNYAVPQFKILVY